ncbi:MAG: PAS domain-containing sensor histidine kinase [Rhizomicrobium sp.]
MTTRTKIQQELRSFLPAEQEARLSAYFSLVERAAHIGYWRYDLSDRSHFWSPGMYRLMGIDPTKQQPDNDWLRRQLPATGQREVAEMLAQAIRTGSPFAYCLHDVTLGPLHAGASGQVIDMHGEVELDDNGCVIALIGVCQNITQRMRDEESRALAQEQYRVMTHEASDIIIFYTGCGDILFASEALERIFGRSAREIERGKFFNLVHPDDLSEARKLSVIPRRGQTITATYRVRHKNGHYLWLEVVTRTIYDDKTGAARNIVSVSRDITARKEHEEEIAAARERAEAANQAKSRFLANMSHELRTPLNAIIGFTDLMRQQMLGPLGNERYEEYADIIHDSGQHLLDLISDMLDMAKIEAGKLKLNFERVNLTDAIRDAASLMQDRADAGGVEMMIEEMPRLFVTADRRAVKQILLNLLSNAIKFTPEGGRVSIAADQCEDKVRVIVRDTGIGIAPEDLSRLGAPFEQARSNPFVAQGGTGLGLALIKSLSESHGGGVTIESVVGQGTVVSVDFAAGPAARAAA